MQGWFLYCMLLETWGGPILSWCCKLHLVQSSCWSHRSLHRKGSNKSSDVVMLGHFRFTYNVYRRIHPHGNQKWCFGKCTSSQVWSHSGYLAVKLRFLLHLYLNKIQLHTMKSSNFISHLLVFHHGSYMTFLVHWSTRSSPVSDRLTLEEKKTSKVTLVGPYEGLLLAEADTWWKKYAPKKALHL